MRVGLFLFFSLLLCQSCSSQSHILYDMTNDMVLDRDQEYFQHPPASLAKMMTAYLVFEQLNKGTLSLDSMITVPKRVQQIERRHIGLKIGQRYSVRDLLNATIIYSANDAAVTLAIHLAGNESRFAEKMTETARALGMTKTVFKNASGLPHPQQTTCAYDMMVLSRALIQDHPELYPLFQQQAFVFDGKAFANSNTLLGVYTGVDGIKTGYISSARHNFSVSAVKGGIRYIAVVLGEENKQARNEKICKLLGYQTVAQHPKVLILNRRLKKATQKRQTHKKPWVIQVGHFKQRSQAQTHLTKLKALLAEFPDLKNIQIISEKNKHRVCLGRFDHPSMGVHLCREMLKKNIKCLVTNLV